MNEPTDPNMSFERPEDTYEGKDFYAGEEPAAGEQDYIDPVLDAPAKPKSNILVTIGIFGGVAIFALVMAWVNFGSTLFPKATTSAAPVGNGATNTAALLSPVAATPTTTTPAAQPVDATAAATTPGVPIAVTNTPTPGAAPAAAPDQGAQPTAAPTDVAALSVTPGAPTTPPPAVNPAATPTTPTPAPTDAAPVIAAVPATGPVVMTPTDTPPATPTTGAAPVAVMPAMPATPATTTPGGDKLADLQQQNQDLTAKTAAQAATINDLQAQLADAQAKLADAQTKLSATAPAPKAVKPAKKIAKKPLPSHHAVAAKAPSDDSDVPPSTGPLQAATTGYLGGGSHLPSPPPYWVLRSAENNSAWVAHPGDGQLYQVTVGDQLPGVGKIISIQQDAGAWVVVGTQGQIRQP